MPLDALCLTAVAAELRAAVAGGKIDKLYQPTRDEVVLYVRGQGENVRLLLSANPGHPRSVYKFTGTATPHSETPPSAMSPPAALIRPVRSGCLHRLQTMSTQTPQNSRYPVNKIELISKAVTFLSLSEVRGALPARVPSG